MYILNIYEGMFNNKLNLYMKETKIHIYVCMYMSANDIYS